MHGYRILSGRYRGELITRVPTKYLFAQVINETRMAKYCQAELDRRGTVIPKIDISAHAIDTASLRLLEIWIKTRKKGEGLYKWLVRLSFIAYTQGVVTNGNTIAYKKILFVFEMNTTIPILKTVMLNPKRIQDRKNGCNRRTLKA